MANLIAISTAQPATDVVQDVRTTLDARQKLADAAMTVQQEIEALDLVQRHQVLQVQPRAAGDVEERGRGGMQPRRQGGKTSDFGRVVLLCVTDVEQRRAVLI